MHDVFIHNAVIHDGERFTDADALLVKAGRISWIGPGACAPAHDGVPSVDLEGRTVLPALCDVHTHPSWIAATVRSVPCVSPIVNTIEEMIEALRRHPLAGRGPEAWITGFGYDEGKLAEHRTPTIEDLDRVSTTQPVFVKRSDCHSAICNSVALRLAGIEAGTPDPAGGRFGRFPDGRPNGVLTEFNAAQVVERLMGEPTFESEVEMMTASGEHFLARGILAFTEMMADYRQLAVYREAARRGFPVRAGLYLVWKGGRDPRGMPALTDEDRTGDHFIAGVKLFADGSVSGATAAVTTPFLNGSTGMVTLDDGAPATAWADPDDPFVSMGAAVTRTAWDGTVFNRSEAVSCEEAVSLYTSRPMKVLPFEGVGRLAPGMRADFIVLRDPVTDDGEALARNAVSEVFRAGALIHRAPR